MILVEFKESILNNAFDDIDEAKKGLKVASHALCDMEDLLGSILEDHEDDKEYEWDDEEHLDGESEVNYRNMRNMRGTRNMRNMKRIKYSGVHGYGRYSY